MEDGSADLLKSPERLSRNALEVLSLTGAYLARLEPEAPLPAAYLIVQARSADIGLQASLDDVHSYRGLLPQITRLARLGMTLEQIEDRLAISHDIMIEAQAGLADIRDAIERGLAESIASAERSLASGLGRGGPEPTTAPDDTQAIIHFLKTKGGFEEPNDHSNSD